MARLVAAEWLKLRTTPLVWAAVPAVLLLAAVAVAGIALSSETAGQPLLEPTDGVRMGALHLTSTGAVLVMVIGIVVSAGEYRTLTATETFLTTPRRERVLAAKLAFAALLGVALGAAGAVLGLPAAYGWFEADGTPFPGGSAELWLTLGGVVLYGGLFAVLGVAFGSLVRNQLTAVVAALTTVLLLEQVLHQSAPSVGRWLPGNAGAALVRAPGELLDPGVGAATLVAFTLVLTAAGLFAVVRRDA